MWKQSSFCVLSRSLRHKQQSQGTGGIFKLAPSNNNNHPHTSASEGESNLFASDIGKISSVFFFSSPFHFLQRACFVPCWPAGGWANARAAFWTNRSRRPGGQFTWNIIPHCMGLPCFIPDIYEVFFGIKLIFRTKKQKKIRKNNLFTTFTPKTQLIKTSKLWSAALQLLFRTTSL